MKSIYAIALLCALSVVNQAQPMAANGAKGFVARNFMPFVTATGLLTVARLAYPHSPQHYYNVANQKIVHAKALAERTLAKKLEEQNIGRLEEQTVWCFDEKFPSAFSARLGVGLTCDPKIVEDICLEGETSLRENRDYTKRALITDKKIYVIYNATERDSKDLLFQDTLTDLFAHASKDEIPGLIKAIKDLEKRDRRKYSFFLEKDKKGYFARFADWALQK